MFKVLFLQRLYGLSDPQIEYQIKDRTSFRDFLGIRSVDDVPDQNTVWKYKEALSQDGTFDRLVKRFDEYLDSLGLIVNEGKIVDASFVIAPRQRNTREENKAIKEDRGGELWQPEKGDTDKGLKHKANKRRHKDIDARWVEKGGEKYYGYKDNVEICNKTKLIRNYTVCAASRHDSKETEHVLTEPPEEAYGEPAWFDAGYVGMERIVIAKHMTPIICEKGTKGHPLTEEQKSQQPSEIKDTQPRGACVRVYGTDNGRPCVPRRRHCKGKSQHCSYKSGLQHMQANTDTKISPKLDYCTTN